MNKYEIIKKIEQIAPKESAENWDCVGFMVETKNIDVDKIMLCLTPTKSVIKQAISQNCDMIIAHHPMFCVDSDVVSQNYKPIIDIYSAHTNLDKAQGGTTDTLISKLDLDNYKIVINHEFLRVIDFGKDISIMEFTKLLSKISNNFRFVNNNNVRTIKKVAFCAGSGSEFIKDAISFACDCLVTGDLKFHTALDSEIVLFDIGHFDSEILILPVIKKIIGNNVEIVYANEQSPFYAYNSV